MKAVWLVRSRELASRIRFWTSLVGYDPRDHSLGQKIYLFYLVIFFTLWGFAVLALLADLGAGMLSFIDRSSASIAAIFIVFLLLLFDTVIRGYSAGVHSPFIFSDTDSELLCQTPVDRRPVALIWCLGDWLIPALGFAALGIVLRFAGLQLAAQGRVIWADIPRYILAGLQVAVIILPVCLALRALEYALGAMRLQRERDNPWLRWFPVGTVMVLIPLAIFSKASLKLILWPLLFTLQAGFGEANWLGGFVLAVILAAGGLLMLYWASPGLNLSRAAQESHFRWAIQQASWLGDSRLIQQMKARQRLGIGRPASKIPAKAGYFTLIWKDWVTTLRSFTFGSFIRWLSIFGSYLGMLLAPDWGTRLWAFIIWSLLVGQQCTTRLSSDLEIWALTRQLPFSGKELLFAEIVTPFLMTIIFSWLGIGVSYGLGYSPGLFLVVLVPIAILCIVLAAALDILRHCRSSELLSGRVPEIAAGGLVFGSLLAGIPLMIGAWLSPQLTSPGFIWLAVLVGALLGLGVIVVLLRLTANAYNDIK